MVESSITTSTARNPTERVKSRQPIGTRIRGLAFDILLTNPQGLRYSELHRNICQIAPDLKHSTVNSSIWNLDVVHPEKVYKPIKGVFRHLAFIDLEAVTPHFESPTQSQQRIREDVFYPLFAHWLKNELEEVTHAISLGGNAFRDRWGTPDVIGKSESRRSDVIKGPTSIVSAEIKVDATGLVIGFGQACAYKLFSHKSYLVIPQDVSPDELARLESLCQMFGIGLVTFNAKMPASPDFRLIIRPVRHEPDLFYTNRYVAHVEKDLFQ
ncbi:hypothetical protein WG899_16640 [Paucibacter sp. AS339]|uniref:hypothetical protein n=1 Tax=Paucibacter hankyongi TaxID=3133434 RepID=UPI0030A5544F